MTLEDEENQLAASLILLLDGRRHTVIARALRMALPDAAACELAYTYCYEVGVNMCTAIGPGDVLQEIDYIAEEQAYNNSSEVHTPKVTATREDLIHACRNHEWGDNGDEWHEAVRGVIEELEKQGFITWEVTRCAGTNTP